MRILLLNQAFYPDAVATSQHVTDLAKFLCNQGYEVEVVAGQRDYNNRAKLYKREEVYQGIRIYRASSTGFGKKSFLTRVLDSLTFMAHLVWRLLWIPKPDVVVAFTSPPLLGFIASLYSLWRGSRCVQWIMDMNPHTAVAVGYLKQKSLFTRLLFRVFDFTMRHADHVVVLDRWMREKVLAHGAKAQSILIVPPWPAHHSSSSLQSTQEAKNPFRVKHKLGFKFIVLYSGNHSVAHPLDTLLEAARQLRDDTDINFLFVGSGLRVRDVSEFSDRYQLNNILQLPHQPREMLRHSLSSADVHVVVMGERVSGLVHTSKIYGVLASGKPYIFVGPRNSHVVDLLQECPFGYHVDHGDAARFVEVIRELQEKSFDELVTFSQKNRDFVNENYSASKLIEKFTNEVLRRDTMIPSKVRMVSERHQG